jgi:phosphoglycolate phosphatase
MNDRIINVLFDLDGTLTDPKEGIINSILFSLKKLGIKESSVSELDAFIGPPLRNSYSARYNLSDKLADQAVSFYREYFSVKGIFENKIYPGVTDLLASLFSHNLKLFVATSKPTIYAEKILEHFKIDRYFRDVIGSNLDNTRTYKSEIIACAVSVNGLQSGNSVMVGDRKHDITGARNNSMKQSRYPGVMEQWKNCYVCNLILLPVITVWLSGLLLHN